VWRSPLSSALSEEKESKEETAVDYVKRESYRISKRPSIWGRGRTLCYNVLSCLSDKVSMQVQTKRWEEVGGPNKGMGFFSP